MEFKKRGYEPCLFFTTKRSALQTHEWNIDCVSISRRSGLSIPHLYLAPERIDALLNYIYECDLVYWYSGASYVLSDFILSKLIKSLRKTIIYSFGMEVFPSFSLRTFFNMLGVLAIKRYVYFHAINSGDYASLRRLVGNERVFHIPHGVDTTFFSPPKPEEKLNKFSVLYVTTSVSKIKGFDLLLNIIEITMNKNRDINFIVVMPKKGDVSLLKKALEIRKRYPQNVTLRQPLTHEELRNLYRKSHVLVFLSRSEGFGNIMLEAQSCGLPVLAFDIPSARDVIIPRLTGDLIKRFDMEGIVKGILKYYTLWRDKPEQYWLLASEARKNSLKFDWSIIGDKLDYMLRNIVNVRNVKVI
jgi:glycosyltransferase involved in cell wall biosynthesis